MSCCSIPYSPLDSSRLLTSLLACVIGILRHEEPELLELSHGLRNIALRHLRIDDELARQTRSDLQDRAATIAPAPDISRRNIQLVNLSRAAVQNQRLSFHFSGDEIGFALWNHAHAECRTVPLGTVNGRGCLARARRAGRLDDALRMHHWDQFDPRAKQSKYLECASGYPSTAAAHQGAHFFFGSFGFFSDPVFA